jgi:hypothetical protein
MKKLLLTLLCLITFGFTNGQSNKEIANVYLKRAKAAIETDVDFPRALIHLNKALTRLDTITDKNIASLASLVYYENYHTQTTLKEQLLFLKKSKSYSKQYFLLSNNNTSEEYLNNVESQVLIIETIEEVETKLAVEKAALLRKEKEMKRVDSLKSTWNSKSKSLSLKVDSIYKFNKNNSAIFKVENYYGVISDRGEVLVKADEYNSFLSFDGFFILKNKEKEATKIYCFNSNSKSGFLLPSPSDFNANSTHYGQVMLPRGNGRLITYPNNSYAAMVYDLKEKKIIKVANKQDLFKSLKKDDVIDKYNKDDELKLDKVWYRLGGDFGGGIYPLYLDGNYKVHSFLCAVDGTVLKTESNYQYIGAFYKDKFQALKDNKTVWIAKDGAELKEAKDESGVYTAGIKVVKLADGSYQFMKEGFIILGDEKLEKITDFLSNNKKK